MNLTIPLYLAGLTDSILYCTVLYCTVMHPHVSAGACVVWRQRMLSSACGLQSAARLRTLKCKVYACPAWLAQPHTGHFSLKLEEKPSLVKISLVGF